jgi:hypothetical protein
MAMIQANHIEQFKISLQPVHPPSVLNGSQTIRMRNRVAPQLTVLRNYVGSTPAITLGLPFSLIENNQRLVQTFTVKAGKNHHITEYFYAFFVSYGLISDYFSKNTHWRNACNSMTKLICVEFSKCRLVNSAF